MTLRNFSNDIVSEFISVSELTLSHDDHSVIIMTELMNHSRCSAPTLTDGLRVLDDLADASLTKTLRSVEVVLSADEHFTVVMIVECVNSVVVSPVLLADTCALQYTAAVTVTSDEVRVADLTSAHETRYSLVVRSRMTHHLFNTLFTHRPSLTSLGLQVRPNLLAVRAASIDDIPQDAVVEASLSDFGVLSGLKQDRRLDIIAVLSEMIGPVDAAARVRVGFLGGVAQVEQVGFFMPLAVE